MPQARLKYWPVDLGRRSGYRVPSWEIESGRPGPCLLVTAAMHGIEVQGCEVIRRFRPLAEKELVAGRLVLVPFTTPPAFRKGRPHIVSTYRRPKGSPDRSDNLAYRFPGDPAGNEADRAAHSLASGLFARATHHVDLHCYNHFTAPAVLAGEDRDVLAFARAAALPFIIARPGVSRRQLVPRRGRPNCPDTWFNGTGRLAIAIEFSGQYQVTDGQVSLGLRALANCSKYLGLFRGKLEGTAEPVSVRDGVTGDVEARAPAGGLFVADDWSPGDFVRKGDRLGVIFDDETLRTWEVRAPAAGRLYRFGRIGKKGDIDPADTNPRAKRGETLAVIFSPGG